jgi:RNA polymerase sigma factor (sigma-70 family)
MATTEASAATADPPAPLAALQTDDFVELFRLHYPRLVRAMALAGADREKAQDLAQEALARTLRHWRRVRRGPNPAGYPYRVAFRLLRRRGGLPPSPLDDAEPDGTAGPEARAVAAADVASALAAMPPGRRACVILCWCLDTSTPDAAETLGISAGTVRKQLELARPRLRAALPGW